MRIYIMTDMEGASGVIDFEKYGRPGAIFYDKAVRLVTMEVNAAIEGILSTGDHEIVVCDWHGHGAIDIELLHCEATMITGKPQDSFLMLDDGHYDAFFMLCQHAMRNAPGANLDHTMNLMINSLHINGMEIGEIGIESLKAGIFDIPFVYLSGDKSACLEAEKLVPGIKTCCVKRGISTTSAVCLQPEKARRLIKESAREAIENMDGIKPLKLKPPFEALYEFKDKNGTFRYADKPYAKILPGNKVHIVADTIEELLHKNLYGD